MIIDTIKNSLKAALEALDIFTGVEIQLEHPADLSHGDYACNVAMQLAGEIGTNPRELAKKIVAELEQNLPAEIASVEVAGPGFINFHLSPAFFAQSLQEIVTAGADFGRSDRLGGQKTIFEYTTQNLMKEFHVGHLMSHVIGNAIANIYDSQGAEVRRDSYQGDVGMHIAKVVWAIWKDKDTQEPFPDTADTPQKKAKYLGMKYSFGDKMYAPKDEDLAGFSEGKEKNQEEIEEINKKIYKKSDSEINEFYEKACAWSLESYQSLYDRLGVELDWQFFESETAPVGKAIVEKGLDKGVFEENEGAVIYRGDEEEGLHTRVFINSADIPTYEAKDLGLMQLKHDAYAYDEAVIFTANEQNEYFKVVLAAAREVIPELAEKTTHIGHGMLQLTDGKMSSRTGNVLSAAELLNTVKEKAEAKISERKAGEVKSGTAELIAQAAIRYAILKQDASRNVIFNVEQSLSFEGDSGPYLQYTFARCRSLLAKAGDGGLEPSVELLEAGEATAVERLLYRFPAVAHQAADKYAPHLVATYLHELAKSFNSFYGSTQIISDAAAAGYRLAITEATAQVLENGLKLLGIKAPEKM
ncbi:MAG: arginine--tRNA ligase [Candidatus Paceibacterota bacterium]